MFNDIWYYVGWFIIATLCKVMLKKNMVTHAPIPKGPKILVANHPTVSDPFVLFTSMRERMSIMIFDKVFSIPIFGTYLKTVGHIPVIRGDGQKAFDRALEFLNRGTSVLIFVEGGISPGVGRHSKPRTGAVRLAYHSGAPIVPIGVGIHKKNIRHIHGVIDGTRIREVWYFHGKYAITVGKHFYVAGDAKNKSKVRRQSEQVMDTVMSLARESTARINPPTLVV